MKGLGIVLCLLVGTAHASTDDLMIQSKVDAKTLNWMVDKTQIFLNNANIAKGISGTEELTIQPKFTMEELSDNPSFVKLQSLVSNVFHVDASQAYLRIRIPKIYYKIDTVKAATKTLQVMDPVLAMTATAELNGIDIGLTDGVQVDLMIPNPKSAAADSFLTATLDPATVKIPENLPPATFDVSFQTIRDQGLHFALSGYNLDTLPAYVHEHQSQLVIKDSATQGPITVNQIHVNPVTVRLGSLSRSIPFDDFKPLIQAKLNAIIGKIIFQIGDSLKTSIGPRVLDSIFTLNTRSDFEFSNSSIYVKYDAAIFTKPVDNQFAIGITGGLCTHDLFTQFKDACVDHAAPYTSVRVVSDADHAAAKAEIAQKLNNGPAAVAFSISEEYLNRLLKTTIDANLWDATLADQSLELGDKGAFVVFNKNTQSPDLIFDLYYHGDGTGMERFLVNTRHPLHFPLRLSTAIHFENRNGVPFLVVKTAKVISDANEIINGIQEYGLSSQLIWGLKGKIAKMVLKMASSMEGKTALEMDLPVLKNMDFEDSFFEVSQFGRMNLYLKP